MLQTPELRAAIETLYRVFQRYELRPSTDPCACHRTELDDLRLHRKPLHKLSIDDLRQYANDALYTWGTGDDFKHFIPRLFELLPEVDERDFVDAATVFCKLTYESWCSTSWRVWPNDEQNAIENYFRSSWDAALNSNPEDLPFDGVHGWIQGIAQAEHDITPYLNRWLTASSVNAHRNLALLITRERLPDTKSGRGYWAGHQEQREQLNLWLRQPEVRQKLSDAVERWSDLPFATEWEEAAVLLP
jgi:hypothetical protein